MSKAVQKYMKKQQQILESAAKLFLEKGYRSTSMDAIAEEADVTKQTVYRYFPSKAELFKEVLSFTSSMERQYEFGGGSVRDELQRYGESFVKEHFRPEKLGFYRIAVAESALDKELGDIFFKAAPEIRRKNLADYFCDVLISENPEKDAGIFSSMLLHIRSDVLLGAAPVPDDKEIAEHCAYVIERFLSGCALR